MPAFAPISSDVSFPELEARVLELWDRVRAFERSVQERPEESTYVFYDGPPFATGLPHYGHLVASTLKDIVPRYWTMRGRRVERRFGWDTHGLPIEMQMEKELGLSGPVSVREYGVGAFNEACRANVLKYTAEWEMVIRRLGRWVDFRNDYKTMDPSFMESVWWVFKQLWDKGLVYRDVRVMPFSWRLSTSLSNFEANLDYRDVQDPAITVTMPLVGDPDGAALLIWTTTPWTLPSNLAVAVGADVTYVRARKAGDDRVFIVAEALCKRVLGDDAEVLASFPGSDLVGAAYQPLFPFFAHLADAPQGDGGAFFVIASGHVTTEDGTGLVHMAPAFGEEDFKACRAAGIPVVDPVTVEGAFDDTVPDYAGQHVKDADPAIIRALKQAGRLFRHDTIQHSYPYCWRSGTPLIYKTVPAWFVRVTALRERMVEHNKNIHWVPGAVGSKRFGNWVADARDWNISRNRFWGTPLPIWTCEACGEHTAVGSIEELTRLTGEAVTDLHPHRIDHLKVPCASCGAPTERIPDVFDCWFESGSMPYAQDHYPFEGKEAFEASFPADFVAEGLDQTRGWFYTSLVLSTALFDSAPFKNVIVNGMVLAEDGKKMSKSLKNYPDPTLVLDTYGADALRAYLINSPVVRAEELRFAEKGVRDVVRSVLLPLRNAWSFFVTYANVDGWSPADDLPAAPPVAQRPELDRWVLSVLQSLVREVNIQMEGYYLYKVVPPTLGFIDDLTNWYIRRSRRRFWRSADSAEARADKAAAYATLYEVLVTFAKVLAPVLPFMAEALYQNLVVEPGAAEAGRDSVHLCDFPQVDLDVVDEALERDVALTRQVVGMGRSERARARLKTRQPLGRVTVVHHDVEVLAALERHGQLIREELNVKELVLAPDDASLASLSFKPNFKRLGRRLGKRMREGAAVIAAMTRDDWVGLQAGGSMEVAGETITAEDVMVVRAAREDVALAVDGALTVALDCELTDALVAEGLAREVTSQIQKLRKEAGLAVTDRIALDLFTADAALADALRAHAAYIAGEVLASQLEVSAGDAPDGAAALTVEGRALSVLLTRA